jgi:hypothetical protein
MATVHDFHWPLYTVPNEPAPISFSNICRNSAPRREPCNILCWCYTKDDRSRERVIPIQTCRSVSIVRAQNLAQSLVAIHVTKWEMFNSYKKPFVAKINTYALHKLVNNRQIFRNDKAIFTGGGAIIAPRPLLFMPYERARYDAEQKPTRTQKKTANGNTREKNGPAGRGQARRQAADRRSGRALDHRLSYCDARRDRDVTIGGLMCD